MALHLYKVDMLAFHSINQRGAKKAYPVVTTRKEALTRCFTERCVEADSLPWCHETIIDSPNFISKTPSEFLRVSDNDDTALESLESIAESTQ